MAKILSVVIFLLFLIVSSNQREPDLRNLNLKDESSLFITWNSLSILSFYLSGDFRTSYEFYVVAKITGTGEVITELTSEINDEY